jgi:hypothetical protein
MTNVPHVCLMGPGGDATYPQLLAGHPRNRRIDWAQLDRYAHHGSPGDGDPVDIFVKTDRDIDAVWVSGLVGPLVSTRLRSVLEPVAGGPVDFLPVAVNGEPFWILRVQHVLDALDLDQSQLRHYPGSFSVEFPVWRGDQIPDPALFTTPDNRYAIWATPTVADAYQQSGCDGLNFSIRGEVG